MKQKSDPSSRLPYEIAQRLKELRGALELTQEEMAPKFGLSWERYRKCEQANASPPSHFHIVQAIHNVPCSANYLLAGYDDNPPHIQAAIKRYRKGQRKKPRLRTVV